MTEKTAAEVKREKEMAARKALFVQGDARPTNTDLSEILGPQEAPAVQAAEPPADPIAPVEPSHPIEAAVEAVSAPAEASEAPEVPATAPKPAKAAKNGAGEPKNAPVLPWANAHPSVQKVFTTRFSEQTHAQLKFLSDHLPKQSIQKLVLEATRLHIEKLLQEPAIVQALKDYKP